MLTYRLLLQNNLQVELELKDLNPWIGVFFYLLLDEIVTLNIICSQFNQKDLTTMLSDIEISQQCELKPIENVASLIGITRDELRLSGDHKAKVKLSAIKESKEKGKLVYVTAMTPTRFGEGKTVTTIGLTQGLHYVGEKAIACIRQPSLGPVFGTKGGAAGGGYSQVVPMEELNLHCTGDLHAIASAHNLASAAIDARIYHEEKSGYEAFEERSGMQALKIDAKRVMWKRTVDHNDRSLRMITVGHNNPGKTVNGFEREDGFIITAASELMAILALATDLHDLRVRIGKIGVAYSIDGDVITAEDLGVAGAMTVIMKEAIEPTLMQTNEGVPVFVHAGPFANIAHGNSSIIADRIALSKTDYVITEGGFGSDMGFEKGCDIKSYNSGNTPDCAVVVATIKAIKSHSGMSEDEFKASDDAALKAVEAGYCNIVWHVRNVKKYGVPVIVAINKFAFDTDAEIALLRELLVKDFSDVKIVLSDAFANGGEGGAELAKQVITACEQPSNFTYLYDEEMSLQEKISAIATKGYGANSVIYTEQAKEKLALLEKETNVKTRVCIAKTPASITDDPRAIGAPTDFALHVSDMNYSRGAEFVYVMSGSVLTMPGLSEKPAFMNIDIDEDGEIVGLS